MDLTKEFKVIGKWFVPDSKHFCFGELSYTFNKGLHLLLFGSLTETKNIHEAKNNFILDCIRGITQDGKCITLINAFGHEEGSNHLIQSKFTIEYASISSTHFLTLESDLFDVISINLNCSETFFSGLYQPLTFDKFDPEGDLRTLQYEKSSPKEIYNDGNITASLFFNYRFNLSHTKSNEFEFSQKVYLNWKFENPLSFKNSITYAQNTKALFSFLSRIKIFFKSLSIRERESGEYFELLFFQGNKTNIEKLGSSDLLIRYKEMKGEFEQIIKWWIKNEEFVTYGLSLYQQFIYSSELTSTQKFLNIVFALETLHSSFFNKKNFSDEEYQLFKSQKSIFHLDPIFKERFNECINAFNEYSFKKRIQDLFEMNREILQEYIGDINEFSSKLRNQRNYFAHKHSQNRDNLIPIEQLEYYVFMSKLIYDVSFLQLIGVGNENIKLILKRDFLLKYYKGKKPK